jgi:hypothetical protein
MRKTLAVLALMLGSLLFLAAPAWAPNLYKINKINSYEALTDCPGNVKIRPRTGVGFVTANPAGTKAFGGISPTPKRYVFNTTAKFNSSVKGTCNGVPMDNSPGVLGASVPRTAMAKTGRPLVPQLALGIGLLLVGGLLIALTVRPPRAVFRRS